MPPTEEIIAESYDDSATHPAETQVPELMGVPSPATVEKNHSSLPGEWSFQDVLVI